ncbi:MFS transporter [Prosthecomicrobium hirschii]|uniref:MFS transporter n=1 Tax=Prosthecodimorpha hirschii TaxID=665126 RepID=UPI00221FA6B8|nr:MFS transporter [Prosthecomicrobium hirschii]MCW1841552.1 MFS transporter [Prosthecomicrobium hirschii]
MSPARTADHPAARPAANAAAHPAAHPADRPDPVAARRPPSAALPLGGLLLAALLASLGTSIANVALPTLAQAFAAPFARVQWVVIAYLIAMTALIVGAGRLGDRFGRGRMLLSGLALFAAASLAAAAAPTLGLLIAARAAQGAGAAILMALSLALVRDSVPPDRIGTAMGLVGTLSAVGTALGPSLGGLLIGQFGWRAVFVAPVPLALVAFGIGFRAWTAERRPALVEPAPVGLAATVFLSVTLAAYAAAMTLGRDLFGPAGLALSALAAIGGAAFVRAERTAAVPLIAPALVRDPILAGSLAANALVATIMMATLVVGPFYLSGALGLDAARVGLIMSVGPVVSMVTGILAGRLVDRRGAPAVMRTGLLLVAAGSAGLASLPLWFGTAGYIAAIAVLTPGYQLFQAANNTGVLAEVPSDRRGLVSGLLGLSRNLGLITGAAAMGAVFALAVKAGDMAGAAPAALGTGLAATFGVAALLAGAALAITIHSRRADGSARG